MKKVLPLTSFSFLLVPFNSLYTQNCSVSISGGNCAGTTLIAGISGGTLAKLTWYDYTSSIFNADTVSSQASTSVVAGNHGSGSASNQLGFPAGGISVDANGGVYIADVLNNRVQKWLPGAITGITVAGGHGAGSASNQLISPRDVFVDASGNIYVADAGNHRIQKWLPGATTGVTVAGGNGNGFAANQLSGPRGVYVDRNGNIYVADTYNYRIQKWKPGATKGTTVAGGNGGGGGANQFYFPIDVYLDSAQNIYVADAFLDNAEYHRVQKWKEGDASGVTVAGGNGVGGNANQFGYLLAIFVDAAGNVYAADNGVDGAPLSRIQKWAPNAQSGVTVAGGHGVGWDILSYPTGVALDNTGRIYVLDGPSNPRVQKYIPTNGVVDSTYSPSIAGYYSVRAVLKNGCSAVSNSLIVRSIPQTPVIYATQPRGRANLCDGGTDTFFVETWDNVTKYKWTIPHECSLVSNYNDSIVIAIPAGFSSGRLTARGSNLCGKGQPDTMQLLGRPLIPGTISGPKKVFANQAGIIYSVPEINIHHNWIVPAGAVIQSGQGSASISVNWGTVAGMVSVNSYNDCGESDRRRELEVSIKQSFAASTQQAVSKNLNDVIVFPNPAKDDATIRFNAEKQTQYVIELVDMNGKKWMQKEIMAKPGPNAVNVDVSTYPPGTYLINIKSSEIKTSLKFTKL